MMKTEKFCFVLIDSPEVLRAHEDIIKRQLRALNQEYYQSFPDADDPREFQQWYKNHITPENISESPMLLVIDQTRTRIVAFCAVQKLHSDVDSLVFTHHTLFPISWTDDQTPVAADETIELRNTYPARYSLRNTQTGRRRSVKVDMTRSLYLSNLFVFRNYRKRRLCTEMLSFLERYAESIASPSLLLHVCAQNEKALVCYLKKGFRICGISDNEHDGDVSLLLRRHIRSPYRMKDEHICALVACFKRVFLERGLEKRSLADFFSPSTE